MLYIHMSFIFFISGFLATLAMMFFLRKILKNFSEKEMWRISFIGGIVAVVSFLLNFYAAVILGWDTGGFMDWHMFFIAWQSVMMVVVGGHVVKPNPQVNKDHDTAK